MTPSGNTPTILLIETGTDVCSVALARGGQIVDLRENRDGRAHARLLAVYINEILLAQQLSVDRLDAVAVGKGPGSFTGLRVGAATAKGLCFGAQKPLIAIDSLQALAQTAVDRNALHSSDALIVPLIDARRMEVYTALFDAQANRLTETSAVIMDEHSFASLRAQRPLLFIGDGAAKCRSLWPDAHVYFADVVATASGMYPEALRAFDRQQFVDLATFEPFYLKDFVVTASKKRVF